MKKEWFVKTLALVIVALFTSVSYQPIIAENTKSVEKESDYNNFDFEQAKEYLFQTIVDISNNPEVKKFLNDHKKDLFSKDNNKYDFKNMIQKICSQNPKLLKSILFTKPEMTIEYLEKNYNKGLEMFDILGKEESSKIVESVKIINPEIFNELKNIILDVEELSNRILVLEKININLKPKFEFGKSLDICFILFIYFIPSFITEVFFEDLLSWALEHHRLLLAAIDAPFYFLSYLNLLSILNLMESFNCDFNPIP